jgi:hypothetical protein
MLQIYSSFVRLWRSCATFCSNVLSSYFFPSCNFQSDTMFRKPAVFPSSGQEKPLALSGLIHLTSLTNKLFVYKIILKPIWTCGIQLWGSAPKSHLVILERFQSKVLRILTDAPRCVPNAVIRRDLQEPEVRQEVRSYSVTYRQRLDNHPSSLTSSLFDELNCYRRLKRRYTADLATRF